MIKVLSNGSKWNGEAPDDIDRLLAVLATEPLDPAFGSCIGPAHGCRVEYEGGQRRYIDTGTLYPGIEAIEFFGNFWAVSHVFTIHTDEPALIDRLTAAIRANQATPAYAAITRLRETNSDGGE